MKNIKNLALAKMSGFRHKTVAVPEWEGVKVVLREPSGEAWLRWQEVVKAGDKSYSFSIDAFRRHCMLNGLDSIGLTLQHEDAISAYEQKQPAFMG